MSSIHLYKLLFIIKISCPNGLTGREVTVHQMIRIVNLRNYKLNEDEILIKVDRSSPVGNPFILNSESERDWVCNLYSHNFKQWLRNSPEFRNKIWDIISISKNHDVALGCWCYPKRCHAETIKSYIDNLTELDVILEVITDGFDINEPPF